MLRRVIFVFVAVALCPLWLAAYDWKVSIREWDVPTPKSRPHDPEVAPNGALWYTGQLANKLGRLDPKTGAIREFPLKTPDSGLHGLAADKEGNIWFTANFKAYIGKLDPRTGEVTEYTMPDPRARHPHSLAFDRDGMIFFTVQAGNFVGKLDPKTGKVPSTMLMRHFGRTNYNDISALYPVLQQLLGKLFPQLGRLVVLARPLAIVFKTHMALFPARRELVPPTGAVQSLRDKLRAPTQTE